MRQTLGPEALAGLIGQAYEAAVEPTGCELLADKLRSGFDARLAVVEVQDHEDPERSFVVAAGLGDEFLANFRRHCADSPDDAVDPLRNAALKAAAGSVYIDLDLQTRDESRQRAVYQRLAAPWALDSFMCGVIANSPTLTALIGLARTSHDNSFASGEREALGGGLLGHLNRSITLQRRLATTQSRASVLGAALDCIPDGVLVLDRGGRAIVVNREAERLLADGGAVALRGRRLVANAPRCQPPLEGALARVLGDDPLAAPPLPVVATNLAGGQPVRITLAPLSGRMRRAGGVAGAIAKHLTQPTQAACLALLEPLAPAHEARVPATLCLRYALTPAEERLCGLLVAGHPLQAAADVLAVSRNTAKTHLARIFDKTGVRSQVALISLLRR